jgi:hypothetical protein
MTNTNPITIEFDISHDSPIQIVFDTISQFDGTFDTIVNHGPAGGNPCLTATFPSKTLATNFLLEIGTDPGDIDIYFD